ncbi:MAG: hypothetical protein K2Y56_24075 [Methylobacterium sp.]|uniref:hypothetical protein n=1 Tax=Methylobacterium sp. TaxID=409 RepID=UPI0025FD17B8|nr:hypothetical protein [Methylobacterium sp.]MBX9934556.1 hypothetical protein [Methylobacterium sp.]
MSNDVETTKPRSLAGDIFWIVVGVPVFCVGLWLLYIAWQDPDDVPRKLLAALDTLARWAADLAAWAEKPITPQSGA